MTALRLTNPVSPRDITGTLARKLAREHEARQATIARQNAELEADYELPDDVIVDYTNEPSHDYESALAAYLHEHGEK